MEGENPGKNDVDGEGRRGEQSLPTLGVGHHEHDENGKENQHGRLRPAPGRPDQDRDYLLTRNNSWMEVSPSSTLRRPSSYR
jgi:hypothetical protein